MASYESLAEQEFIATFRFKYDKGILVILMLSKVKDTFGYIT